MSKSLVEIEATLPPVPSVGGTYNHAVRAGNLLYLAGKGVHVSGKVGREFTKEQAYIPVEIEAIFEIKDEAGLK